LLSFPNFAFPIYLTQVFMFLETFLRIATAIAGEKKAVVLTMTA